MAAQAQNAPRAGTTAVDAGQAMACPDPSAHRTKATLADQASAAALYSTNPNKAAINPLGPDGKLSSASAATSLKHAQPHELPSYPVVGIDTQKSAGTAATLAHANQKSPEWWKPEQSAAAGKAALLANGYKMAPLWQPEASAAGSKAAILAHKEGVKLDLWSPEASAAGGSAAMLAFKKQGLGPVAYAGQTDDEKRKALLAATGAVSSSNRKRAQSNPQPLPIYPDSANSAKNALGAATLAHSASTRAKNQPAATATTDSNRLGSGAMEAARIQHSKASREMYTERPPVAIEVEERRHQDALRASAISMAKKLYDVQQQHIDNAAGRSPQSHAHAGATLASSQQPATSEADIKAQAMQYIGIQEAAQKLAAERLSKIGPSDESAYRSYYGYDDKPTTRSRLTIRRNRGRSSTNPETIDSDSDEDDFRSRRIRAQMNQFNKSLAEVDAKKRERDQKALMAAAERKVQSQMLGIDKKIFDQTGKMSPAMIEEWDAKARAKAAANSEARMENHGRVHIGNDKYIDQAEVNAIAQARIQPTLDEITEKTEKRRAEEEERRLDLEERKRQAQIEKEHAAEVKAEEKRVKDEEKRLAKSRNAEEKAAAKQEKEAEKEKKAEKKRLAQEEERKSKEVTRTSDAVQPSRDEIVTPTRDIHSSNTDELYSSPAAPATLTEVAPAPEPASNSTSPTSPKSPNSKGFKNFLQKFKRRSKHSSVSADANKPGFIGGINLRESTSSASVRAHSTPASTTQPEPEPAAVAHRYSDVSSVSDSDSGGEDRGRAVDRRLTGASAASEYSEARDNFDEQLAPPPAFTSKDEGAAGRKGSPVRDSKFLEVGI